MENKLRIATFNLENLDDKPNLKPTLDERIAVMKPQLIRLNADILCLQEVNGQEEEGQPRRLLALEKLLTNTPYAGYQKVSTMTSNDVDVYDERNLIIISRYNINEYHQYKHDFAASPHYQKVTEIPPALEAKPVRWERPILYAQIDLNNGDLLHVINLHLKSRIPSNIDGQKIDNYTWKTASGWAEGYFLSSMKRVGQALETRILIDTIFDQDENALIVVCGDFNSDSNNVPVEAIKGNVENTGNGTLAKRVLVPCEHTVPEPSRYTLFHHGHPNMLDHLLASRSLLSYYKNTEIHNEILHDESIAFATDKKYPESDHAPIIAKFELPND